MDPAPILELSNRQALGADISGSVPNDPLQLSAEFTGQNIAILAVCLIAVVLGGLMAIRMRPPHHKETQS